MRRGAFLFLILLLLDACVDRIVFDVDTPSTFSIVVDGHISDEPGPYVIKISKAFDIESKLSIKTPITVKKLTLSDDEGTSEMLAEVRDGEYQTSVNGIRGVIGRKYSIEIELLDGRVYQSTPDPLLPSGAVESVSYKYKEEKNPTGPSKYGFDVSFNSTSGGLDNYYFLWRFVGTFQVETNPELNTEPCGESRCPKPLPCSAYALVNGELTEVRPCECCTCWTSIFNTEPVISNNQIISDGQFSNVIAGYVPIDRWVFMHKVHAEVQQMSLSPQAFKFWKAVKAQKQANGSLFQPVAGKIPSNFFQVSGQKGGGVEGIFFATSIAKGSVFITRDDVPDKSIIPESGLQYTGSCLTLFPNSTTTKPLYWVD